MRRGSGSSSSDSSSSSSLSSRRLSRSRLWHFLVFAAFSSTYCAESLLTPLPEPKKTPNSVSPSLANGYKECNVVGSTKDGLVIRVPAVPPVYVSLLQPSATGTDASEIATAICLNLPPTATRRKPFKVTLLEGLLPTFRYRRSTVSTNEEVIKRQKAIFTSLIVASAGFVDVLSLRTYGCFVNMCTGSTIRIAVALAEGGCLRNVALPAAVTIGYVTGIALARMAKYTVQDQQNRAESTTTTDATDPALTTNSRRIQRVMQKFLLPSRNNPTKSLTSAVLLAVTPMIMLLFGAADVLTTVRAPVAWHALPQAAAYGLVHQAASDATGSAVLYMLTGYYAGISRSSVDYVMVGPSQQKASLATIKGHAQLVASFVAGVLGAVVILNHIAPLLPVFPYPVHSMIGLLYATLFFWYGGKKSSYR